MVLSTAYRRLEQLIPAIVNAVVVPPLLALMVTTAVIAVLMRSRVAVLVLDHPNQRSLHAAPTPRLGGIGVVAGVAAAWAYAAPPIDLRLLVALALLVCISLLDDLRSVGVPWRLALHFTSALLAMAALLYPAHGIWLTLAATLAATWLTNLYNFMDGADGLAGGMALIGFGTYGVVSLLGGDFSFAAINLSVAAAAGAFLFFNFPPARVFMGDVGSIPLGYLAAVLDVSGWLRGNWPLWFGIAVFSPFIVDASLTLLKRLLRGAKVWQAHREHYYQRLVRNGWGHRKTAVAEYVLMALCSGAAIFGARHGQTLQLAVLGALALFYAGLVVALERYFPRHA